MAAIAASGVSAKGGVIVFTFPIPLFVCQLGYSVGFAEASLGTSVVLAVFTVSFALSLAELLLLVPPPQPTAKKAIAESVYSVFFIV